MKSLRVFLVAISLFAVGMPQIAHAQDAEKRNEIIRLLKISDAKAMMQQLAGLIIPQFNEVVKKANPDIPDELIKVVNSEMLNIMREHAGVFMEELVVIYARHFTTQEIKRIADFYETPLGQKAIRLMPKLFQEGQIAGQKWAENLMPLLERRVREKLEENGYQFG